MMSKKPRKGVHHIDKAAREQGIRGGKREGPEGGLPLKDLPLCRGRKGGIRGLSWGNRGVTREKGKRASPIIVGP